MLDAFTVGMESKTEQNKLIQHIAFVEQTDKELIPNGAGGFSPRKLITKLMGLWAAVGLY